MSADVIAELDARRDAERVTYRLLTDADLAEPMVAKARAERDRFAAGVDPTRWTVTTDDRLVDSQVVYGVHCTSSRIWDSEVVSAYFRVDAKPQPGRRRNVRRFFYGPKFNKRTKRSTHGQITATLADIIVRSPRRY